MAAVIAEHRPSESAVEAPFHGVSARSALQLAHARGVILAALGAAGVPVFELAPATIKKAVTGNGSAEKPQVGAMIVRLVPGADPQGRADVADAIAAALCRLFGHGGSPAPARAIRGAARAETRRR
jgi:crossover junction endodeoxyribonuclease RuvC